MTTDIDPATSYVVAVFPGDHDERTCAAGFLTEDGSAIANSCEEPDTITRIAIRLLEIADEIRVNRAVDRLQRAAVDG